LTILGYIRTVQNGHWQADCPNPKHLEDPKTEEFEEVVTLVIETIIFPSFQNPEEQKPRQSGAPDHDKERAHNIACTVAGSAECKGKNGKENEVGASSEISKLVELQCECYRKEEELISNGDEKL
jgi:hypothetical protein